MRELIYPESPWLAVAYTELAGKTFSFIVFEMYNSCRLSALSRDMIQEIRRLDLTSVLGCAGNAN